MKSIGSNLKNSDQPSAGKSEKLHALHELIEFTVAKKLLENACFRLVYSNEYEVGVRKTTVNGRIAVIFHGITEHNKR